MKTGALPKQLDLRGLAARGVHIEGTVSPEDLPRLADSGIGVVESGSAAFDFRRDEEALSSLAKLLFSKHMRYSLLLLSALFAWTAQGQTTFNVDMTCAPEGFTDVFVTGPWCGWCANDTYNNMTDPEGDGVYSVTVADLVGTVEYKYAINGFDDQENLINDMVDGATCAPITGARHAQLTTLAASLSTTRK